MSRVGKYPFIVPEGVNVNVENGMIVAKGKLGELSQHYSVDHVDVKIEGNQFVVSPKAQDKKSRALWGTTRANINILVQGVSAGFKKDLELIGVGYKARVEGSKLVKIGRAHV